MMRFYWRWARGWLSELPRRLTERMALGLLDRMGDAPRLDAAQRSWLLQDFREDLDAQIEDAEDRGITERGARELVSTQAIVEWLEVGDFPPAAGIELLEKAVATIPRQPSDRERWQRDAYLAAIAELGGDEEAAAKLWRDGVDERTQVLLDFLGRKLRGRMEELGLTIGDLAERTGIYTVRLVAVLFGQEEMGAIEWIGLSEALDVPLAWMLEGIRFVLRTSPEGRGFYEIEPAEGESAEPIPRPGHQSDGLGGDPQ